MRTLSRAPAGSRPPRGRGRGRRREQGRQHRVALIRLLQRRQRRAGAEGHAGVGTLHLRKSARSSTSTTSSATKWTRISLHQRRRRFHRKKTLAQKAPASVTPIRRPHPGPSTWCFHELCHFSGAKIYPGKGIRFIRADSQASFLVLCKIAFQLLVGITKV